MGIRRRYKRLPYYFSWKHPKLFYFVRAIAFPVQVLTLCLVLFAFVTFYQKHFSFEANMRARAANEVSQPERSIVTRAESQQPHNTQSNETISLVKNEAYQTSPETEISAPTKTETTLIAAIIEPPITPPSPVGTALIQRSDRISTKTPPTKIATTSDETDETIASSEPAAEAETKNILGSEWLAEQRNNQYVVQLATSSLHAELVNFAQALPVEGPLVIYPYKKNSENELVYGLSAGLHNSITEANAALEKLPTDSAKYGYWIRATAEINFDATGLTKTPE